MMYGNPGAANRREVRLRQSTILGVVAARLMLRQPIPGVADMLRFFNWRGKAQLMALIMGFKINSRLAIDLMGRISPVALENALALSRRGHERTDAQSAHEATQHDLRGD